MLTWALIQHDHDQVIARVRPELDLPVAQARAQALHTLSKVGDTSSSPGTGLPRDWLPVIERAMTSDNDEVRLDALTTKRIPDDPDLAFDTAARVRPSRMS